MKYREFNRTGEKISLLGLGTLRFPTLEDGSVNFKETIELIRSAIDNGVNYIDLGYKYHDGQSEVVVGEALKDGYREKVFVTDKMLVRALKKPEDMESMFQEQLKRLGIDYFDFYFLHNVNRSSWETAKEYRILEFLEKKREEGYFRHLGFSYHDDHQFFKEIIDSYPWDVCQIQLNYMDAEFQAGVAGLKYASTKNIPVVVMEPLKGGRLVIDIPQSVQALWDSFDIKRSPQEWGFKWVADFPEVLCVLSGITTKDQLRDCLNIFDKLEANELTMPEQELIKKVSNEYNRLIQYSCTECKYCLPCPADINIPHIIRLYNEWHIYEGNPRVLWEYDLWYRNGIPPSSCLFCKKCESKCPQGIPISEVMKKASNIFEDEERESQAFNNV